MIVLIIAASMADLLPRFNKCSSSPIISSFLC
jgi:hypothetical protein